MKYFKFIMLTLIAVAFLFFGLTFISPSVNTIERSVVIIGNRDSVFKAFSTLDWNHYEKAEKVITGDSLLQFQFYTNHPELFVNGTMKFSNNNDTTFVTYINKVTLPLTMRLMSTKITERMTPQMDNTLYGVKQSVETAKGF